MLLRDLTSDIELSASNAALNDCMNHTLPLLADLPISRLLAIRREERDSFERYRLAVRQILTDISQRNKRISKKDVRQLFRERIEPELAKMKSELYQERRRQRRRIGAGLSGLAAMAAGVAMGAFGGIVPGVATAATAAGVSSGIVPAIARAAMAVAPGIAGTSLLGKAAQSYCEHGATLKEKNDFYFLLRLTQEVEG